jgi:hypothetical protein
MKGLLHEFKISLTSYVSLAFIFFLLLSAGTLVSVNYYRTSNLAIETTLKQFDHNIRREKKNFKKHFEPASFRLNLHAGKDKWQTFSAYKNNPNLLYELANYLAIDPLSNSVHLGFKNGNFVSVRKLLNANDRRQSKAPSEAHYLFEILEYNPSGSSKTTFTFLDNQQEIIAPSLVTNSSYQIFNRPWYIKGLMAQKIALVAPYQEYQEQHRIITLVLKGRDTDVVHAIDVNVLALSDLMQVTNVTDSDLQVLISSKDEILAYQFSGNMMLRESEKPIDSELQLDYQTLVTFANEDKNQSGLNEFVLNGEVWVAKVAMLSPTNNASIKLLSAAPKKKIINKAKQLLFEELLLSMTIILLFIPLTWLFARVLVHPLKHLLKTTHQLAGLNFDQVHSGHSFVSELSQLEQDMLAVIHSLVDTFSI